MRHWIKGSNSMKKIIPILLITIFTIGLIVIAYFSYNENVLEKSIRQNEGDYVVLLHGLGRSSWSMQDLGKNLAGEGYRVININYPTRSDSIKNLVESHLKVELEEQYVDKRRKINFVTHSMGGAMVRYFLANNELKNLNRVVMLAPPSKGAERADEWSKSSIMSAIMGPATRDMSTNTDSLVNTMSPPYYEVGIIAGEYDKKVSIENTKLDNMKDFLVVKTGHTFIMNSDEVIGATIKFLDKGKFE